MSTAKTNIRAWIQAEAPQLTGTEMGGWLVEHIGAGHPPEVAEERVGVYLATPDVGVEAALDFWRAALVQGVGMANPRTFPWTLASSAASHIALKLNYRGPNYTIVGDDEAASAVAQHALADLRKGRIEAALVGALETVGELRLAALWLVKGERDGPQLVWKATAEGETVGTALEVYGRLVEALEARQTLRIGLRYEGGLGVLPAGYAHGDLANKRN